MGVDLLDRLFSLQGKTALISGGYKGIGRMFAETYAEAGKSLVKKMIPINRVGNLDELRSTALFLATCPSFLTEAEIYVDGGHTLV